MIFLCDIRDESRRCPALPSQFRLIHRFPALWDCAGDHLFINSARCSDSAMAKAAPQRSRASASGPRQSQAEPAGSDQGQLMAAPPVARMWDGSEVSALFPAASAAHARAGQTRTTDPAPGRGRNKVPLSS